MYAHGVYEVQMNSTYVATGVAGAAVVGGPINLAVTGIMGGWTPGMVPHIIKGVAVVRGVTTFSGNTEAYSLRADISTAGTPTVLCSILAPTAGIAHKSIYYTPTYEILVSPGQHVNFHVTAAGTGWGNVVLLVEPKWEEPDNVTGMYQTT
jgi:hypothetical protein